MQLHSSPRTLLPLALLVVSVLPSCNDRAGAAAGTGTGANIVSLMQARSLSETDVVAALKTYTPTGRHDEYYTFASGGHGAI
jgi:nitrous-oxide reductase